MSRRRNGNSTRFRRPGGSSYPEGSFNDAVRQALARKVEQLKALRAAPGPGKRE